MSIAAETVNAKGGKDGVFIIPEFELDSGKTIHNLRIAYTLYGERNPQGSNLILLLPGTSNTRYGVRGHIGIDAAFDPSKYCIVSVDAIGGGDSSQPGDGLRHRFPIYSVADMVRAQYELVTHGLSLHGRPLAAVGGASMGAFQALQWAAAYPDAMQRAVLLVPAVKAGGLFRQTVLQMKRIVALDANWSDGSYSIQPATGLAIAGRHYFPWTVTDAYLETMPQDIVERDMDAVATNFASWDAWSLIRRYEASSSFDLAQSFDGDLLHALNRIQAKLLVLPCAQDRLLGIDGARQIAQQAQEADYAEIQSNLGHLAWRAVPGSPQTTFLTKTISTWLR
ncbi:alpha/beta fold hydrolase [Paracandidimonas soli]|uniref:Homoserine O-acetyltransferase n=1 Tax=Paracandidimonas soli TaxID=1917182 RepID=A0A4R3V199_9BURK|nr:alpha/beta fold hydrolase [Paracandidimonas soli]TCU96044.1 homoserine O-acetyltransferase [Paracandidimonas soli]